MTKQKSEFDGFVADSMMGMPARMAAFLDWAADAMPKRSIDYEIIAKIVFSMPLNKAIGKSQVQSVMHAKGRAKKILMDRYGRGMVASPGQGIRATIGSEDMATTQVYQDTRRAVGSLKSLDRSRSLVKIGEIQDKDLKARMSSINGVMKVLVNNDVLNRLLPEKSQE